MDLNTVGKFTWDFGQKFFIETDKGNYIWSHPDYNGDNTITAYNGTYQDWLNEENIDYGRSKGRHVIETYCGSDVKFI